jgi:hypothetical protein
MDINYCHDNGSCLKPVQLQIQMIENNRAIVVVIIWLLDLQLPIQSIPITTKVVSLNPVHGEMYLI